MEIICDSPCANDCHKSNNLPIMHLKAGLSNAIHLVTSRLAMLFVNIDLIIVVNQHRVSTVPVSQLGRTCLGNFIHLVWNLCVELGRNSGVAICYLFIYLYIGPPYSNKKDETRRKAIV